MATQVDVRRIACALPETVEGADHFAFSVKIPGKKERGFAWVWLERLHPKKARVPNPAVVVLRVADEAEKALLLGSNPAAIFTEPHYNGYAAVLVRLDVIELDELAELVTEAWRCVAPAAVVAEFDRRHGD